MYFKSQKNDLASFQYLENFERFSKHLKTVYSKIEYAESENEPFFRIGINPTSLSIAIALARMKPRDSTPATKLNGEALLANSLVISLLASGLASNVAMS